MSHTVWIEDENGGYAVRCIPHGYIGWAWKHLTAFVVALAHDYNAGGGCLD